LRTDTVVPTTSVSQKEETVGAFLTLVPDAQDDGQILLSVAYDNTVAQPIKTVTFGGTSGKVDIQQITIDGNGTVQQVALRAGQPMLIAGFEKKHQSTSNNRVLPDAPLIAGGAERTEMDRVATLILVRAQVEEGI
jgi:type II secretory pathway component GspD/PulD (secretin)